ESSDTPLLLYSESSGAAGGIRHRFTCIFSNEDGGTGVLPPLLMARYGRTTDIEWVSAVTVRGKGDASEEVFQSEGHGTRAFHGVHAGRHPVLLRSTDNNNFSDDVPARDPCQLRISLAPLGFDGAGPRERMMDSNPWTWWIANAEMRRERLGALGL